MADLDTRTRWKRQVGSRLKAVRAAAGFPTAREFSGPLEFRENTYTTWERGERTIQPAELAKIRERTGVTSDYIYYGDPSRLPIKLRRKLGLDPE